MSTELIIVLAVVGMGGLIGLFYVSHAIEKQRRQKALLIANLSDFAFRLQRLLDYVPPAYSGKDLRLLLLKQIKKRLERLTELAPGNEKFRKKLESCNAQIGEVQASSVIPQPPQIKTAEEANELRTLLLEMSKVVENFAHNKTITTAEAQKHLLSIQNSFIDANLNHSLQIGQVARQEQKPKLAIHHFQKALAEMLKINQHGKYNEKIEHLKVQLRELQSETGVEEKPAEVETNSELTKGMDEMLEEKDAWKKKYF